MPEFKVVCGGLYKVVDAPSTIVLVDQTKEHIIVAPPYSPLAAGEPSTWRRLNGRGILRLLDDNRRVAEVTVDPGVEAHAHAVAAAQVEFRDY